MVVGTIDGAVLRTGLAVRAKGAVPGVTSVAVGVRVRSRIVGPAPVVVESDSAVDGCAATGGGAALPGQAGVNFRSDGAGHLGTSSRERESEEREALEHVSLCRESSRGPVRDRW